MKKTRYTAYIIFKTIKLERFFFYFFYDICVMMTELRSVEEKNRPKRLAKVLISYRRCGRRRETEKDRGWVLQEKILRGT